MAIKSVGPGGPQNISQVQKSQSTDAPRSASFARELGSPAAAKAQQTPMAGAIKDVAQSVASGKLARGQAVYDAVISRMIELEAGGKLTPAQRQKVAFAQSVLGDDPNFTSRIDRLLQNEIEALNQGE